MPEVNRELVVEDGRKVWREPQPVLELEPVKIVHQPPSPEFNHLLAAHNSEGTFLTVAPCGEVSIDWEGVIKAALEPPAAEAHWGAHCCWSMAKALVEARRQGHAHGPL